MIYDNLDPIIQRWAARHSLLLYTKYKDEQVRTVDVGSPSGRRYQIWIDAPASDGSIVVHVWDYRRRRGEFRSNLSMLDQVLDRSSLRLFLYRFDYTGNGGAMWRIVYPCL